MFKIKDQTGKRDNKRQSIATGFENLWLVISLFGLCKFMKKKFFSTTYTRFKILFVFEYVQSNSELFYLSEIVFFVCFLFLLVR